MQQKHLYSESFGNSRYLIAFVEKHSLVQDDILAITESLGYYTLFYYSTEKLNQY